MQQPILTRESFATLFWGQSYFGAYPTEEHLRLLESEGFDYIIKLNLDNEKNVESYSTTVHLIEYPIKDNNIPQEWEEFSSFICYLGHLVQQNKKIYIHCKGGHGRSCLIVTCVLYHLNDNINAREAIERTVLLHNQRSDLSTRWKTIKSPFSKSQYIFLYKFLNPICILKAYNTGYQAGFSASSLFQIENELGTFSNIDAAFQAFRASETEVPDRAAPNGVQSALDPFVFMLRLTQLKFTKYPELQGNLVLTGIRKIYDFSRYAFGENMVGRCLMQVRNQYLIEKFEIQNNKDKLETS